MDTLDPDYVRGQAEAIFESLIGRKTFLSWTAFDSELIEYDQYTGEWVWLTRKKNGAYKEVARDEDIRVLLPINSRE